MASYSDMDRHGNDYWGAGSVGPFHFKPSTTGRSTIQNEYLDTSNGCSPTIGTLEPHCSLDRNRNDCVGRILLLGRPNAQLETGAQYNPGTDTWTPTAIAGAVSARSNHIAVWTGSKMIVWDGDFPGLAKNTGGIYDPSMDSPPKLRFVLGEKIRFSQKRCYLRNGAFCPNNWSHR